MAIPEAQLDTWTSLGSVTQSASTYATIKGVLEHANAPYVAHSYDSFLQGSYGNDTNVYADSDVDIVMRLKSMYYYKGIDKLPADQQAAFKAYLSPVTYSLDEFKADVTGWLAKNFGQLVPGKKAVPIPANGSRRKADVVIASQFRRYTRFVSAADSHYHEGIQLVLPDGTRIENFPKQHSANCTAKHQATSSRFKPTVRIFKNLRNRMVADGRIVKGVAPSYFIEGMLWNVPDHLFVSSHATTFINCYNWVQAADKSQLTTASGLHWLSRDNSATSWPTQDMEAFLSAAATTWDGWK